MAVFQPGEETAQGAQAMIDDGLLKRFPIPDVVLGQHVMVGPVPTLEISEFVGRFFVPPLPDAQRAWRELIGACPGVGLQWITRPSINVRSATRYPDLVLYAGEATPLLIVENKIGSGIGEHKAEQTGEDDTEA
jgi:hypothetical protein